MITPDLYKTLLVKDENIGFTLFEKPKLDLSEEFCRADSILSSLLCFDPQSKEFALRYNLDRSLIDDERLSKLASLSPQLEEKSPFNTLMSNTLIGASGWPSLEGEERQSRVGLMI